MGQCMSRKAAGAFAASAAAAHSKPTSKMQRQLPVSINFLWPYCAYLASIDHEITNGWMTCINGIPNSNSTILDNKWHY